MRVLRLSWLCRAALLSPLAIGCDQGLSADEQGPIEASSFAVSDFFTPSGHMGDGQEPGHLVMDVNQGCLTAPGDTRGNCYRFTYGPPGEKLWAGVFWAFPANNWGAEPGRLFRPWRFDADKGVIRQRYNRISFLAAGRRDTFEVSVRTRVEEGGETRCYTLREAEFEFSGAASARVKSEEVLAKSPEPSDFTPCPEAKARIVLPPGDYKVRLRSGFSVEVDGMTVDDAKPQDDSLRFEVSADKDTSEAFKLSVDGAEVPFALSTPPLQVSFFAGGIRDDRLEKLRCPKEGLTCRYTDNVLTSPKSIAVALGRELTKVTIPSNQLRFELPCVQSPYGVEEGLMSPVLDEKTSELTCPDGTWTTDGLVATCPLGLIGALQLDGKIICCDGGNPVRKGDDVSCGTNDMRDPESGEFVSTPRPMYPGKWRHVEDIEGTLLGSFGWSTSYAEFETEAGSGELSIPRAEVPSTYVYVDNIVWDYARQE